MDILKVIDLEKSYIDPDTKDRFKAVDRISFEIKANQIYGILGPNGAGKTTTLEMIEGLTGHRWWICLCERYQCSRETLRSERNYRSSASI